MARHLFPFSAPKERDDRYDYVAPTYATNLERVYHDLAAQRQRTIDRLSSFAGEYRDLSEGGVDAINTDQAADDIQAAIALPADEPKIEGSPS